MITLPSHTTHALQPLDVSCFKPFQITFKKKRNNSIVRKNYNESNKATFASWVYKALDLVLSKGNIKNRFQVTRIQLFNPKAMDGKTKPNELYIIDHNNNTLNDDNVGNYDEIMNDIEGWVKMEQLQN
jgi:hypothetical protein